MNEMEFCFKKIKITEPLAPLDLLVHFTKKAYIPGRFISEATKNTYDTIEQAIRTNNSGLAVLVNFEKVFNSVSFKFIQKNLEIIGFGENFRKWIIILLGNSGTRKRLVGVSVVNGHPTS